MSSADSRSLKVAGVIKDFPIEASGVKVKTDFVIIEPEKCSSYKVLLGRPWLRKVNAKTNWDKDTITISYQGKKTTIIMNKRQIEEESFTEGYETNNSNNSSETEESSSMVSEESSSYLLQLDKDHLSSNKNSIDDNLNKLITKYKHLFPLDHKDMKQSTLTKHKINLKEGSKPVKQPCRINPKLQEVVKNEIKSLIEANFIFPISESEWISPIVVVPKKNGKLRMCVDYRQLNKCTIKDKFSLPYIDQVLDEVSGHETYSFIDGYSEYYQVEIQKEHQNLTTFVTPWGTYAFRVMPFGLCNAPSTFQRHE